MCFYRFEHFEHFKKFNFSMKPPVLELKTVFEQNLVYREFTNLGKNEIAICISIYFNILKTLRNTFSCSVVLNSIWTSCGNRGKNKNVVFFQTIGHSGHFNKISNVEVMNQIEFAVSLKSL